MRAFRIGADGVDGLVDVAEPELQPGYVRIAVTAAGLCHSDVNVLDGLVGRDWKRPFTLGHEVAGTVTEVHADADPSWLGAQCVVYAPTGCMECSRCLQDAWNYCTRRTPSSEAGVGLGGDGGLAEQMVVHPRRLLRAKGVEPAVAAVLTDAGLTAFHAAAQVRHRGSAAPIVVIGIGGLGHLALQVLRHASNAPLVAVDRREEARDLALNSGADYFCTPAELPEALLDVDTSGGAGAALDFVGTDSTMSLSASVLLPDSDLVIVGSSGGRLTVGKDETGLARGMRIHFPSWGTRSELQQVLELAQDGVLRPVVSTLSLDQVADGLNRLRAGGVLGRLVAEPSILQRSEWSASATFTISSSARDQRR
jgi:alcohol dehydrogenase, propanol-preferring